jgi:hypothetical protein
MTTDDWQGVDHPAITINCQRTSPLGRLNVNATCLLFWNVRTGMMKSSTLLLNVGGELRQTSNVSRCFAAQLRFVKGSDRISKR